MTTTVIGALVRRDARIATSYRLSFALELFFGVLDLVLYFFISRTFAGLGSTNLGAAPTYFAFAVVGIVIAAVLTATSSSVSYRIRDEQVTGTLEALAASPATSFEVCVGLVGFPFAFALARAGLYLALAATVMDLDVSRADWFGLGLIMLATGAAIAPIGILAGAAALTIKRGHVFSATAVILMTIVGGMVFPVAVLPDWLEWVSRLSPLRYAFDGARDAVFAGNGWGLEVLVLCAIALALWPIALALFSKSLGLARKRATLAEF